MQANFDYVGLTSTLAADMEQIQKHCFPEYPHAFGDRRINPSQRDQTDYHLSPAAEKILRKRLAADFRIYKYVVKQHKKQTTDSHWHKIWRKMLRA